MIAWLMTGLSIFLIPVYYKIFKNEQILMIQFLIPKIDPNTDFGYTAFFSDLIINVTFMIVTLEVFFCAVSAIFSVYIIITGNWPAAYPYFVLNFNALYIYCFLGTALDNATDRCVDIIYEIEWYNLDLRSRKMILVMLIKAQKKTVFTVGGVAPLSVNTALQVTKTIYSYIMMLMSFVD
ncbi:odorant receptor 67d-like [Condylostylus longicornis]|uniref:odorant receptor 67d-like n=1 Tax=Condylostylus longicornis TaxID=2530218 RepID=UPI00244DEBBC|nr:odorant receptor 67d-like [Condylostylus longicornis]